VIDQKVLRDALGWGAIALALVVVGLLMASADVSLGTPVAGAGGALLVLVLAVLAWELLRRD